MMVVEMVSAYSLRKADFFNGRLEVLCKTFTGIYPGKDGDQGNSDLCGR